MFLFLFFSCNFFLRNTRFTVSVGSRNIWHQDQTKPVDFLLSCVFVLKLHQVDSLMKSRQSTGQLLWQRGLQKDTSRPVWALPRDLMVCFSVVLVRMCSHSKVWTPSAWQRPAITGQKQWVSNHMNEYIFYWEAVMWKHNPTRSLLKRWCKVTDKQFGYMWFLCQSLGPKEYKTQSGFIHPTKKKYLSIAF